MAKKLTKKSFIQLALENGKVMLDKEGDINFVVTQINDTNFNDISPKLMEQLKNENKYNLWIGFITSKMQAPYSIQSLPIFGNSNRYILKHFQNSAENAINDDLNDRSIKLLKRANEYIEYNL